VAPQRCSDEQEFSAAQARQFAARIAKTGRESGEASVEAAWRLAFGRPPAAAERQTALDYVF